MALLLDLIKAGRRTSRLVMASFGRNQRVASARLI